MSESSTFLVIPGQVITSESGFLRGHGTYIQTSSTNQGGGLDGGGVGGGADNMELDDLNQEQSQDGEEDSNRNQPQQQLIASVCGIVSRINKLISVLPLKPTSYSPQIGDLVIGKVSTVSSNRWLLNIGASRNSILNLSSVNLPGGAQRIRTYEDQLQMRKLYIEGDLVSGEVQTVLSQDGQGGTDGVASLHARSWRYGKLENGVLLVIPCSLIRRMAKHFVELKGTSCSVLIGVNGWIWITRTVKRIDDGEDDGLSPAEIEEKVKTLHRELPVSNEVREEIYRIRASILILEAVFRYVNEETIMSVYQKSISLGLSVGDMLLGENIILCSEDTRKSMNN